MPSQRHVPPSESRFPGIAAAWQALSPLEELPPSLSCHLPPRPAAARLREEQGAQTRPVPSPGARRAVLAMLTFPVL